MGCCIGGGEVAVGVGIDGGSVLGRVGVRGRWKECVEGERVAVGVD